MATILLNITIPGITGLTVRTLTGDDFSSPSPFVEVSGGGGLYRGTVADEFDIAQVVDTVGTVIAEADNNGFTSGDRADLAAAKEAAEAAENYTRPMAKQLGLVEGVTATHNPEGITVSDGDGSTTIADNLDGSYTVGSAP